MALVLMAQVAVPVPSLGEGALTARRPLRLQVAPGHCSGSCFFHPVYPLSVQCRFRASLDKLRASENVGNSVGDDVGDDVARVGDTLAQTFSGLMTDSELLASLPEPEEPEDSEASHRTMQLGMHEGTCTAGCRVLLCLVQVSTFGESVFSGCFHHRYHSGCWRIIAAPDVLSAQLAALALGGHRDGEGGDAGASIALRLQVSVVPDTGSIRVSLRERLVQAVRVAAHRSRMNEEHVRDYAIPAVNLAVEASAELPADFVDEGQCSGRDGRRTYL